MATQLGPPQVPPTTPPPDKKPIWPRRHPILTTIIGTFIAGLALIIILVAALGSAVNQATKPTDVAPSPPATTEPTTPTPSAPQTLAAGQKATITQYGRNAATLTITSVTATTQPLEQYGLAPVHGYFITAHVQVTANSGYTEGFNVNPLDFYAVVNGQHFEWANGNATVLTNALEAATLRAGESTSGIIAFDVPAAHGKIAYAPNLAGGPVAYWKF